MNGKILVLVVLVSLLSGCGQEEPAARQEKTFGGQLGDSYNKMLDDAKQGAENANEQIQHTEQAVRERN